LLELNPGGSSQTTGRSAFRSAFFSFVVFLEASPAGGYSSSADSLLSSPKSVATQRLTMTSEPNANELAAECDDPIVAEVHEHAVEGDIAWLMSNGKVYRVIDAA
jgi:hypothetical protein